MNLNFSIVIDEAEPAELVHEKADPGSRRANHFSQRFLSDVRIDRRRVALLAKIRQQKKKPRKALSLELNNWSIKPSSTRLFQVNK